MEDKQTRLTKTTRTFLLWGAIASLVCGPGSVFALGIGQIQVRSALNQRLVAELQLFPDNQRELNSLRADVAYQSYGGSRVGGGGNQFSYSVTERGGQPVLRITSARPVREPLVNLLVELQWDTGRLVREFAVFLDPAGSNPNVAAEDTDSVARAILQERPRRGRTTTDQTPARQARPAEAAPAEPAQPPAEPAAVTAASPPAPQPQAQAPAPQPTAVPESAPAPQPAPASPGGQASSGRYGPVAPGESLWVIAERTRPAGVGTEQMMRQILRANPRAFVRGNPDALMSGVTLEIPGASGDVSSPTRVATSPPSEPVSQAVSPPDAGTEVVSEPPPPAPQLLSEPDAGTGQSVAVDSPPPPPAPALPESFRIALAGEDLRLQRSGLEDLRRRVQSAGIDTTTTPAESVTTEGGAEPDLPPPAAPDIVEPETIPPGATTDGDELAQTETPNSAASGDGQGAPVAVGGDDPITEVTTPPEPAEPEAQVPQVQTASTPPVQEEPTPQGVLESEAMSPDANTDDDGLAQAATSGITASGDGQGTPVVEGGDDPIDEEIRPPEPEPEVQPPQVAQEGPAPELSTISQVLVWLNNPANLQIVGGGLVGLLALGFIGFKLWQRRRGAAEEEEVEEIDLSAADEEFEEETVAPVAPASDEVDLTKTDPLDRADMLLELGDHEQAEEVLRSALDQQPRDVALRSKLLEVYHEAGDAGQFRQQAAVLAGQLGNDTDHPQWQRVVQMGRELAPEDPLFAPPDEAATQRVESDPFASPFDEEDDATAIFSTPTAAAPAADDGDSDDLRFDFGDDLGEPDEQQAATPGDDMDQAFDFSFDDEEPAAPAAPDTAEEDDTLLDLDAAAAPANETSDDEAARHAELSDDLGGLDFSFDDDTSSLLEPVTTETPAAEEVTPDEDDTLLELNSDSLFESEPAISEDEEDPLNDELASLDFGLPSSEEPSVADTADDELFAGGDDDNELELLSDDKGGEGDGEFFAAEDYVETKLDLANAYIDMEDPVGARSLLEEVLKEGNSEQQQRAEALMQRLS